MVGHIRFGARIVGLLVVLKEIVFFIGLFLSDSEPLLFQVFPHPVLRGILFSAGVELALIVEDIKLKKPNLFVLLAMAGITMGNMGLDYFAGLLLYYDLQHRCFKI